jgi:hypothetical protein
MSLSAAEVRRHNFASAVEAAGGVPAFCKKTELNPDYVRQLLNGKDHKGGRNIGERAARKIEGLIGKERNWLDQVHGPVGVKAAERPAREPQPEFQAAQLENSLHAIRLALGALFVDMARFKPAEGARVAETIRATIPENFQDRGLLAGLLEALDAGTAAAKVAPARKRAPRPSGRSS